MMIGAIFLAVKPELSSAQNAPYRSYQLKVYCENSQVASATFWHDVGTSMGLKQICAGNCPRGTVPLAEALAGLPAEVSAALKAKVDKHQENAAAGKGRPLICLRDGKKSPDDKCQPDKGALCESIGQATRLIKEALIPAGSAELYKSLQQSLRPLLDKIRRELCDDPAAQAKVDELHKNLDSLNFVSGQSNLQNNLRLRRLEDGFQGLAAASCVVGRSPAGRNRQPCAPGEKEVTSGDEEAKKQITDGLQVAIDELKNTAEELEGQGGDAARKIEDIKGKLAKYEQIKGFWENIKAGSCVPANVLQTMRQVANDRRSDNYSNNCLAMCSALADWFVKVNPGPQPGPQRKFFIERCLADCN
ncbi:MAG: hypothetical protein EHM80_15620 [Nitrospiraceae bacterium]|nr:MAG: hypothetical protein EHM80_15620 [Nitrospiraceae bacterium]